MVYMAKRTLLAEISRALLGETPVGVVGALLQWLAIAVVIWVVTFATSLVPIESFGLAIMGVAALLGGLVLSFRGKSLGPIVAIPCSLGIAIIGDRSTNHILQAVLV